MLKLAKYLPWKTASSHFKSDKRTAKAVTKNGSAVARLDLLREQITSAEGGSW